MDLPFDGNGKSRAVRSFDAKVVPPNTLPKSAEEPPSQGSVLAISAGRTPAVSLPARRRVEGRRTESRAQLVMGRPPISNADRPST
jgi:hypothetical protein